MSFLSTTVFAEVSEDVNCIQSVSVQLNCDCKELGLTVNDTILYAFPKERIYNDVYGLIYNSGKDLVDLITSIEIGNESQKINDDHISIKLDYIDHSNSIVIDGGAYFKNGKYYQISNEDYNKILLMCLQEKYIQSGIKCIDDITRKFVTSDYRRVFSIELPDGALKTVSGDSAEYVWHCFNSLNFIYDDCFDNSTENMNKLMSFSSDKEFNLYSCYFDSSRFCVYPTNGDKNVCFYKINYQEYIEFSEGLLRALNSDCDATYEISEWALNSVESAINNSYINEINKINYKSYIDRAEFSCIVYNMLSNSKFKLSLNNIAYFDDISNPKISSLYESGLLFGTDTKKFSPYSYLAREQAAAIFERCAKLIMQDYKIKESNYLDKESISPWAESSVNYVSTLKIMNGDKNRFFNPKAYITKEESIVALVNLAELF